MQRFVQILGGIDDADLAVLVSHAIAALPPDDHWMPVAAWRKSVRAVPQRPGQTGAASRAQLVRVEEMLRKRKLVEVRAGRIRSARAHYVARSTDERWSLSVEFCALFVKGLLDKLALPDAHTGTYLRNHYLHVTPQQLAEFQKELPLFLGGFCILQRVHLGVPGDIPELVDGGFEVVGSGGQAVPAHDDGTAGGSQLNRLPGLCGEHDELEVADRERRRVQAQEHLIAPRQTAFAGIRVRQRVVFLVQDRSPELDRVGRALFIRLQEEPERAGDCAHVR